MVIPLRSPTAVKALMSGGQVRSPPLSGVHRVTLIESPMKCDARTLITGHEREQFTTKHIFEVFVLGIIWSGCYKSIEEKSYCNDCILESCRPI